MSGAKQDFAALTTMRAIGALCVIEFHAWIFVYPAWSERWIVQGFELWPDYFFALSGFILMHVYGNTLFSRKDGVYNYFVHRIARIYPLHVFVLFVLIGLEAFRWAISHWVPDIDGHFFTGGSSPKYILTNLLLIQAWGVQHMNSWNFPAWSISAEFACYLLFPLLLRFGLVTRKLPALALVALSAAGFVWMQVTRHTFDLTYDLGVPRAFFSFSLGCVLYHYRQAVLQRLAFIPPLLLQGGTIVCVIAADITNAAPLVFIPLWILLIASFTYEHTPLARALSWGPLVQLGEMSYSLYMIHTIVLWPLLQAKTLAPDLLKAFIAWPPVLILLTILGTTTALSVLTYRYIENPGRSFIRKRFDRKARAARRDA
jgi:peptidoglycan/LPS O-acetylase OafA/YrhL